jgi:signal transduction histidine kinase
MLSVALINLLSNANRHTNNGSIHVSWLLEQNTDKDKCCCLTVSDTGEGIASGLLPNIFERGVSGSGSTGLGLSIVKSAMDMHKGEVSITSEVGKGTTVKLFFPPETE